MGWILETASDSNRRQSLSLMSPFDGLASQTPLTPNSQIISTEEQSVIHKQAGLLAIHTYCAKHGQGRAKEILDGVTKVKNFLTNLIQLSSKSGPHVHSAVHSLVQKLVVSYYCVKLNLRFCFVLIVRFCGLY